MADTGRPSKYKEEYCDLVKRMASLGLTESNMAMILGIGEKTFNVWKNEHPEFRQANAQGKVDPDQKVVDSLYKRAIGGFFLTERVKNSEGEIIKEIEREVAPDTVAATKWLFNRKPKDWRERIELSGIDLGKAPLNINFNGTVEPELLDPAKQDNLEISTGKGDGS